MYKFLIFEEFVAPAMGSINTNYWRSRGGTFFADKFSLMGRGQTNNDSDYDELYFCTTTYFV